MKEVRPILLVEDSQNDRELMLLALRKNRILNEVIVLRDGEEALLYLGRAGQWIGRPMTKPALVLLDLKLPKVDGMQILEALRSNVAFSEIRVVILSSSGEQVDRDRGDRLGASSYVVKPSSFQELVREISTWKVFEELVFEE